MTLNHPPRLAATIRQRVLITYRTEPALLANLLPAPFRPQVHDGMGLVGLCLLHLDHVRPRGLPAACGVASQNAAHRIAVEWDDPDGPATGVYVLRRDTTSQLSALLGGRAFPGRQHRAEIHWPDRTGSPPPGDEVHVRVRGQGQLHIELDAQVAAAAWWPPTSVFGSMDAAVAFYRRGSIGFSPTVRGGPVDGAGSLDGMEIRSGAWPVAPLDVVDLRSSVLDDHMRFPAGSLAFDHALLVHDVDCTCAGVATAPVARSQQERERVSR